MERKKQVTIYDLAKSLGVSTGTVNRALHNKPEISEETRNRVLSKAREMNFKINPAARSLSLKAIRIGIILVCSVDDYVMGIKKGMDRMLDEIGEFNIQADYFISRADESSKVYDEVTQKIREYEEDGIDGIVFQLQGNTSCFYDTFMHLVSRGIRIACVTSDLWGMDDLTTVCVDGVCAGGLAAEILNMCCAKRNIGILVGNASVKPHCQNIEGFKKYSQSHPFNSIRVYEHSDEPGLVEKATLSMLKDIPDIDGVYMATASAPIACAVIQGIDTKHEINIVTTDVTEQTREFLSNSTIRATIFQNPYFQGKKVVELLYKQIYENANFEKYLVYPQVVFRANMDKL